MVLILGLCLCCLQRSIWCFTVTETSNGLQAWRILKDTSNHIDLVLTEVNLPRLSGIALLCKIMNHKSRKNIPVISEYILRSFFHRSF